MPSRQECLAEGFDLFQLAGDVFGLAILGEGRGGPLEVAVKSDAVGQMR